ncbi:MAG: hypothetical protein J5643_00840 [Lachnospiraceae bacterium]|nr:hypothetical protein [Lachnospiraceae bacterium]
MRLQVQLKKLGARGNKVVPVPFKIDGIPSTVGELIAMTAKKCAEEYNERVRKGETMITPLSQREISDMAGIGRITFGICNGDKEQDVGKAVDSALLAFHDGLFCLFINKTQMTSAEQEIVLKEDDVLTFIRLTMLSGRIW